MKKYNDSPWKLIALYFTLFYVGLVLIVGLPWWYPLMILGLWFGGALIIFGPPSLLLLLHTSEEWEPELREWWKNRRHRQ